MILLVIILDSHNILVGTYRSRPSGRSLSNTIIKLKWFVVEKLTTFAKYEDEIKLLN